MSPVWDALLPRSNQFTGGLPSVQAHTASSFLHGYMDTAVTYDFEAHFLGCIRMQCGGFAAYLLMPIVQLVRGLPKRMDLKEALTVPKMKEWAEALDPKSETLVKLRQED